jgi:uncharacterized Zn finger protein
MSRYNSHYSSRYEDHWPTYVTVAERRRDAALAVENLRKTGHKVAPVTLEGNAIATTFWGKAWCSNLERYRDYANRIERGRSYVRNGSVVDLQIAPREVTALVSGSELYEVKVSIGEVGTQQWASICKDCTGAIDSLVELLQGRFAKGVMERICRQGDGLFPQPSEIRFSCSCPDHASMCKHVAAVLYGVGARLDKQPELLFRLRAVNETDLLAQIGTALPFAKQVPDAGKVLASDDLSALFGLDMDIGQPAAAEEDVTPAVRHKPAKASRPPQPKPSDAKHKATAGKSNPPPTPTVTTKAITPTAAARKSVRSPTQAPAPPRATAKRTVVVVAPPLRRVRPKAS